MSEPHPISPPAPQLGAASQAQTSKASFNPIPLIVLFGLPLALYLLVIGSWNFTYSLGRNDFSSLIASLVPLAMGVGALFGMGKWIRRLRERRLADVAHYPPSLGVILENGSPQSAAANAWDLTQSRQALYLPWTLTRSRALRFERQTLRLNPAILWVNGLLIALLSGIGFVLGLFSSQSGLPLFGSALLGASCWVLFAAAIFAGTYLLLYPRARSERSGTLWLCSEGVYNHLPDRQLFIPWKNLIAIHWVEGSTLFFQVKEGAGSILPCEAFDSEESMRRFYEAAQLLWHNQGKLWPEAEILQEFAPPASAESVPRPKTKR